MADRDEYLRLRIRDLARDECLQLNKQRKHTKRLARCRLMPSPASHPNHRWSMDFIHDRTVDGRKFRTLCVVDQFSRKCMGAICQRTYPSIKAIAVLENILHSSQTVPSMIALDNGPEFTSMVFDRWAHERNIQLDFITPGRPCENGFAESFHGRIRDECLNPHVFQTIDEAQFLVNEWVNDHNNVVATFFSERSSSRENMAEVSKGFGKKCRSIKSTIIQGSVWISEDPQQ